MESKVVAPVDGGLFLASTNTQPWSLDALCQLDTSKVDLLAFVIQYHHSLSFPNLVRLLTFE
jgi:hypothetical protein